MSHMNGNGTNGNGNGHNGNGNGANGLKRVFIVHAPVGETQGSITDLCADDGSVKPFQTLDAYKKSHPEEVVLAAYSAEDIETATSRAKKEKVLAAPVSTQELTATL